MPHVIVKLWPGKSEQQKARLADKITKDIADVFNYGEESVSVGFEEVRSQDWKEKVYKTGHPRQMGQALQKAGIRDVKDSRKEQKGRIRQ
jgi:4-oxalocrotonate tautomerase